MDGRARMIQDALRLARQYGAMSRGYADGGSPMEPQQSVVPMDDPVSLAKATLAARPSAAGIRAPRKKDVPVSEPVEQMVDPSIGQNQQMDFQGEDHPAWIPQRLIAEKAGRKRDPNDRPKVDMDVLRSTPKLYQKQASILRGYKNVPESMANATDDEVMEHFINHVKDNLLTLHDAVPEHIRERSKRWYDGGRKISDEWAAKYNVPNYSVAGAIAALSPQTDWYANVSRAERVLDALKGNGQMASVQHGLQDFYNQFKFSPEMDARFKSVDEKGNPYSLNKPAYEPVYNLLAGKSLGDMDKLDLPPKEKAVAKAMWIRLYDEAHNPSEHKIISPEGDFMEPVMTGKGTKKGAGWGSLIEIAKAIRSVEAVDSKELSELMGEKHKVRNFYNNIISPNSRHGDVTMDTHAIAAGLLRPLSGSSLEVAHNLDTSPPAGNPGAGGSDVTGIRGTYPIFAEAYRRAAKERDLLPRQMQSITWEAVRGLFPDVFKRGKDSAKVDAVWDQYRAGKLSRNDAISQVFEIAGAKNGIRPPTWYREESTNQPNAPASYSGDEGQLSGVGSYGQGSQTSLARSRGGNAGAFSEKEQSFRQGDKISIRDLSRIHPAMRIPGVHIRTAEAGEPKFTGDE